METSRLIQIIEMGAARNLMDYVQAFQLWAPKSAAAAMPCAGGLAAYTGPDSPLTTVKGAGPDLQESEIEAAELFFRRNHARQVVFECAPWLTDDSVERLKRRGYTVAGTEVVVAAKLPCGVEAPGHTPIELMQDDWARVFQAAFELPAEAICPLLAQVAWRLPGSVKLGVADADGSVMGCAQMAPAGEIAVLGNDGTLPEARGKGVQTALIRERLRLAMKAGFRWAVAEVAERSQSEKNYLRCGFERVYVRTSWIHA
ncbi:GNAT family N-acetyltransferase [Paludibaculum fermentans]|uniref:GNAT family N-acetyltransferase n=1 Tax=Paludibaculum fermentans TaxID=1473598 RepID=UPI003EC101F2